MAVLPPLSLYVHLPWCVRKCPYCDFNSHTGGDDESRGRYVEALLADIRAESRRVGTRPLVSIFLGGGTPSLFRPDEIGRVIDAAAGNFAMADDVEVTLEANPGTVECGDPRGYRSAGVNRLSLGAQSFDDASLEALGRIHGVDDIGRSFAAARQAGFDNINLDLMYALPGQEVAAAIRDIEAAARLGPEHLSWYQLTLEPNTVFYARPPDGLPDEEAAYRMQRDGEALLAGSGYGQYEVSAYARDGRRCVHNLNYWRFGDYAAVGAGAHGKLTTAEGVFRYSKPANARQYMQATAAGHDIPTTRIGEQDLVFEFMLNALRLVEGFDQGLFSATTGLPQGLLEERLVPLVKRGLIAQSGTRSWCPTATGSRFLNDLQAHFLP